MSENILDIYCYLPLLPKQNTGRELYYICNILVYMNRYFDKFKTSTKSERYTFWYFIAVFLLMLELFYSCHVFTIKYSHSTPKTNEYNLLRKIIMVLWGEDCFLCDLVYKFDSIHLYFGFYFLYIVTTAILVNSVESSDKYLTLYWRCPNDDSHQIWFKLIRWFQRMNKYMNILGAEILLNIQTVN